MECVKIVNLYDLQHTIAKPLLENFTYPWEALSHIGKFITELQKALSKDDYDVINENVYVAKTAKVAATATLNGPAIICDGAELRTGAFIRGNVIIGANCVAGNSCEFKNAILFDNVQVPHFNYVGDSILGHRSHMGAGSITSNVKSDKTLVKVRCGEEIIETGLKKFGAMLGDNVEVGCNSVLNPGTVVCRNSNIYPLSCVRGVVPANSIYKDAQNIVVKRKDK
jgi:NDP-sugar pyrophosphorylase family protein